MGTRDFKPFARMARPILSQREYDEARKLLRERVRTYAVVLEAERLEALIRELTHYEDRCADTNTKWSIEGAEYGFLAETKSNGTPHRRWSDQSN
jgi:hypothetical protein